MAEKLLEPITPGEILLEEFLKPLSINQKHLAESIKVPANRISQIVNGKREITADTALRLGRYFNIEPEFWLNLQMHYNLKTTRKSLWAIIEKEVQNINPTSAN
jgi:addiction module HigA family antidote